MKFHGITIEQGANINNLVVASGTSFPTSPDEGELFFRSDAAATVKGLYIYVNGSWDRIASTESLTAPLGPTLPGVANTGDLFYRDSDDANEGLYIFNGTGWVAVSVGGVTSFTVSGDVNGTIDGGTDLLTLATVNGSPGSFGSASQTVSLTVNSKGLVISATQQAIAIPASAVTSGTLADGRVAASNVTQHQGALAIAASQTTSGTFADARIAASNVTQHQAALSIAETQIPDGAILARVAGNETISGTWSFNNAVAVGAPVSDSHAATKQYVDTLSAGVYPHEAVRVATTGNITLSGTQTIDDVAVVAGNRVLVKNQTTASQNGVYVVAAGAWSRATDFDGSPSNEILPGDLFFVTEGTVNANTSWILLTSAPITIGTTALAFSIFSRTADIDAGTGLTRTGNTLDIVGAAGRIVANVDNIDLATIGTPVTDVLRRITTDAYGRVTATSAVQTADLSGVLDTRYVRKDTTASETMVGNLIISRAAAAPQIALSSSTTGNGAYQFFQVNGVNRWVLGMDGSTESGSNAGSNFFIQRYNDAGGILAVPLSINRATGQINLFSNVISNSDILTTAAVNCNSLSIPATATGTGTTRLFVDSPAGQTAPIVRVLRDGLNLFSINANGAIISTPTGAGGDRVLIVGDTATDAPNIVASSRAPAGTAPGKLTMRRTNGATGATPDNSVLGQIIWDGLDTSAGYEEFAQIRAESGVNTATGAPTAMIFSTHNGTGVVEELRIDGAQNLITAQANFRLDNATPSMIVNATSGNSAMFIRGPAGTFRNVGFQTGTSDRWRIFGSTGTAETGSNAGSDFQIVRYNDAGVQFSETPLVINRATGLISSNSDWYISRAASINFTLNSNSTTASLALDFRTNNASRWIINKNNEAETGSNAGSNFAISRYSDAGALLDTPIFINRSSGYVTFTTQQAEFRSDQVNFRRASSNSLPFYMPFLKARGTLGSPLTTVANDNIGMIQFYAHDGTNDRLAAEIGAFVAANPASSTAPGFLSFRTAPAGTSQVPVERMRITSAGDVVIGSATVSQARLNVVTALSGTYGSAGLWMTDNATTSLLMNNTAAGVSSIWASGDLTFGSGSNSNVERMRITSAGNLEVSGTSGQTNVRVSTTDATGSASLQLSANGTNNSQFNQYGPSHAGTFLPGVNLAGLTALFSPVVSTGLLIAQNAAAPLIFATSALERARIRSDGNITIGAIAGEDMGIYRGIQIGNYGTLGLQFEGTSHLFLGWNTTGGATPSTYRYRRTGDTASTLEFMSDGSLRFYNAPSGTAGTNIPFVERFHIDSAGSARISAASNGTPTLALRRTSDTAHYTWLEFERADGTRALELIANGSNGAYGIPANAAGINAQGTTGLHFSTADTLRMSITGGGAINAFENISVLKTTAAAQSSIVASSTGSGDSSAVFTATNGTQNIFMVMHGPGHSGIFPSTGWVYTNGTAPLVLGTGSTERMRISTSGEVTIARTTSLSSARLTVEQNGAAGAPVMASNHTATSGTRFHSAFYESGVERGSITSNGSAVSYNTTSDQRLKKNVVDAPSAVAKVQAMKVRSFDWKISDQHVEHGFIAQELAEVEPSAVTAGDVWQVDHSKLVATLTKALQEALTRIESLEAQVAALK